MLPELGAPFLQEDVQKLETRLSRNGAPTPLKNGSCLHSRRGKDVRQTVVFSDGGGNHQTGKKLFSANDIREVHDASALEVGA